MTGSSIDKTALTRRTGVEQLEALERDVSSRQYFRGKKDGKSVILMLYPEVNEEHRAELQNFIRIGEWLNTIGIKTPALYDLDEENIIAQFEDLGKTSFGKRLREKPEQQEALYTCAVDVLKRLSTATPPDSLPAYRESRVHENRRQLVEYYIPLTRQKPDTPGMLQDYLAIWDGIENTLPPCPQGFIHGDYHLENLMWAERESGLKKCALIDYQDALYGNLPYDLVNLLEDARIDVPKDLRTAMIERYCQDMTSEEKTAFRQWYRVLGTQFHCRVIGLFIKLAVEQGRDAYLIHINRLQNYIGEGLKDPLLTPLKLWFEKEGVDFLPINDLHGDKIRTHFKT